MQDVLVATAYERKAELGGGARGVVLDKRTKERYESPVLDDVSQARAWAKTKVFALMGDQPWAPGYIYKPEWRMYVYIR